MTFDEASDVFPMVATVNCEWCGCVSNFARTLCDSCAIDFSFCMTTLVRAAREAARDAKVPVFPGPFLKDIGRA